MSELHCEMFLVSNTALQVVSWKCTLIISTLQCLQVLGNEIEKHGLEIASLLDTEGKQLTHREFKFQNKTISEKL